MKYKKGICWIRRDLRLSDHRALHEACKQCEQVHLVFVFDTCILKHLKSKQDSRVTFIHQSLLEIDEKLNEKGSSLIWLHGDPKVEIPKIAKQLSAEAVFANRDYEPYAKARDEDVSQQVELHLFKDQIIFGSEVLKGDQTPYRVFTPYKNAWLKKVNTDELREFKPDLKKLAKNKSTSLQLEDICFEASTTSPKAGESAAKSRLRKFLKAVRSYSVDRDFPAIDGTSRLSVDLRFGTISIRECVRHCWRERNKGSQTWLSELIWRDFFNMIMDQCPQVTETAFLEKYRNIKWPGSKKHFQKWCEGKTGYPIVDAAMRQLNETGWMHNRLRMIAASFLVKDLLVDWKWGEAYFAEKLIDFDLASNNGGWQWCASTGCDAQPYFRIFNPTSQSLKFDESGEFIKKYVPELKHLSGKELHFPVKNRPSEYPDPIVDHGTQRDLALQLFKASNG